MDAGPPRLPFCAGAVLAEGCHLKLKLVFEGHDEECLLIRFRGRCYAYINRCVHMPRPLDCEKDRVFDRSGLHLRCSMHGIVYTPETGTSVSALCEGERLRTVFIYEENGEVGIADWRVGGVRPLRAGT